MTQEKSSYGRKEKPRKPSSEKCKVHTPWYDYAAGIVRCGVCGVFLREL